MDSLKKHFRILKKMKWSWTSIALVVTPFVFTIIFIAFLLYNHRQTNGIVVSSGYGCSQSGAALLREGGSAVDAAISALLCAGVSLPQLGGLGGGFVATLYMNGKMENLFALERAAINVDPEEAPKVSSGPYLSNVPAELLGFWEMHQKYGELSWSRLFDTAVDYCRDGVPVSTSLASSIADNVKRLCGDATLGNLFVPGGKPLEDTDILIRPNYAKTLTKIAREGPEAFYNGELGETFIRDVQEAGGCMTMEDLRNMTVEWKKPLTMSVFEKYNIFIPSAPSAGPLLMYMFNVLKNFPAEKSASYWSTFVETLKYSYAIRPVIGDPFDAEYKDLISAGIANATSFDYALHAVRQIKQRTQTSSDMNDYGVHYEIPKLKKGTVNVVVKDTKGNTVVITSDIGRAFGTGFASKSTGIILNNKLVNFKHPRGKSSSGLPVSPTNRILKGKRALSPSLPVIILYEDTARLRLAIGASGGLRAISSIAQVVIRNVFQNKHITLSLNEPRIFFDLKRLNVILEEDEQKDVIEHFKSRGHTVAFIPQNYELRHGVIHAVSQLGAEPFPGIDIRGTGAASIVYPSEVGLDDEAKKKN